MRSCGLDISTCTGMALVGEGEDRGKVIHLSKEKGFSRVQSIAAEVARTIQIWNPSIVVVEKYAFCRNVDTFITLVEIGTAIKQKLYELGLSWVEVAPTTLKKWTTGKGSADKATMAASVCKRWGYNSTSDDIVDAYALAQMGQLEIGELIGLKGVFVSHFSCTLTNSMLGLFREHKECGT